MMTTKMMRGAAEGAGTVLCCHLDPQDRVQAVGGAWDMAARLNGGEGAFAEEVLGRPIWAFVSGDETRSYLNALFFWCRSRGGTFRTRYQYDTAALRRRCVMEISPLRSGLLKVESRLAGVGPPAPRDAPPVAPGGEIRRCSICLRAAAGEAWRPCGHPAPGGPPVRYVVCGACRADAADALREADMRLAVLDAGGGAGGGAGRGDDRRAGGGAGG
ncbi:hypothetical protein ACQ5SO_16715 [Rhodovulum sp. DZ06]|uniref:hypothetical protein n=1 Tax=Rhodovulum sp. DZ06 TaxID=3425126 RepID=UPI003D345D2A